MSQSRKFEANPQEYCQTKTLVKIFLLNKGIVQPRESEIAHLASTAFTEFFPVEGSRPKILPLTERSHHHNRQLTYWTPRSAKHDAVDAELDEGPTNG